MSRGAKRENFYRRDPMAALNGMVGLSLEERGVYNTVIDLLYSTWRPVEDNRHFIANWCGCAVQKLNPIIERLIVKGKLRRLQEGRIWFLTNDHFDDERAAVKGLGSGRKTAPDRGEVGEKSEGVEEKSASVSENLSLVDGDDEEKQSLTALEKTREDKRRISDANASSVAVGDGEDLFEALWKAYPHVRGRSSKPKSKTEWGRITEVIRETLPRAGKRYRDGGTIPPGGAPSLAKWLADELWRDWLDGPREPPVAEPKSQVIDYAEVRERIQREAAEMAASKAIGGA